MNVYADAVIQLTVLYPNCLYVLNFDYFQRFVLSIGKHV